MGVELPLETVWQIIVSVAVVLLGGRKQLETWFGSGQDDHDLLTRLDERQKQNARRLDRMRDELDTLIDRHYEQGRATWFPRSSRLPDAGGDDARHR